MPGLSCAIGNHEWDAWELRPPIIGVRASWLYWQRTCRRGAGTKDRCRVSQRRWFRVDPPVWLTVKKSMPVAKYLARLKRVAPRPDDPSLIDSQSPPTS